MVVQTINSIDYLSADLTIVMFGSPVSVLYQERSWFGYWLARAAPLVNTPRLDAAISFIMFFGKALTYYSYDQPQGRNTRRRALVSSWGHPSRQLHAHLGASCLTI